MAYRLLVVDDEPAILKGLKFSLEQESYIIETADNGEDALNKAFENEYDLIVLDLMLPGIDGIEVCKKIREKSTIPIIILTAKGEDTSKISGLEYGADDYLTKPFNILELKARIKAILRRTNTPSSTSSTGIIKTGDFIINTLGRIIDIEDKEINLTAKEFDLFLLLVSNPEKVYSREELLKKIWGHEYYGDLRTVDVHIRRLREKIEQNPSQPRYILTKWGVGYYFKSK